MEVTCLLLSVCKQTNTPHCTDPTQPCSQSLLSLDPLHHTASTSSDQGLAPFLKHAGSSTKLPSQTIFHFLLHGVPSWARYKDHEWKRRLKGLGLKELLELQQRRQPVHVLLRHVLALHFGGKQQHEPTGSQKLLLRLHSIKGAVAESTVSHLEQHLDHQEGQPGDKAAETVSPRASTIKCSLLSALSSLHKTVN